MPNQISGLRLGCEPLVEGQHGLDRRLAVLVEQPSLVARHRNAAFAPQREPGVPYESAYLCRNDEAVLQRALHCGAKVSCGRQQPRRGCATEPYTGAYRLPELSIVLRLSLESSHRVHREGVAHASPSSSAPDATRG